MYDINKLSDSDQMFVCADTVYKVVVKCIPIHLGFESCVIYRCERSQHLPQTVALSLLDTSPGKTGLFLSNQKSARFR